MAGCKLVTRKLTGFHGRSEEFTNVYFFGDGGAGLSPDESTALALLDALIASEKTVFSGSTQFLGGAAYKIGVANTPGDTDAIAVRELVGTSNYGSATFSPTMYPECAIDLKFLLGGRRYLRSMLHTTALHGYDAGAYNSTASGNLSAALRAFADKQISNTWPGGFRRIAPNGDIPTAIMYNPYLEHRQFHRYRRRNAGLLG